MMKPILNYLRSQGLGRGREIKYPSLTLYFSIPFLLIPFT